MTRVISQKIILEQTMNPKIADYYEKAGHDPEITLREKFENYYIPMEYCEGIYEDKLDLSYKKWQSA